MKKILLMTIQTAAIWVALAMLIHALNKLHTENWNMSMAVHEKGLPFSVSEEWC